MPALANSNLFLVGSSAVSFNRLGPVTDYTSLDFEALKEDFKAFAQANYSDRWTDFNETQFAIVFLDIQCYMGDMLTYYLNAGLREVVLVTAQRRQSVVNIAKGLNYKLKSASGSTGNLNLLTTTANLPITVQPTSQFAAGDVVFQPDQIYTLTVANGVDQLDGTHIHTIKVVQGQEFANVTIGTADGSREQVYLLPQKPVIDGTLVVKVNGVTWALAASFSQANPTDEVYRVETDDEDETRIFFGDGINGKIPPVGQAVSATWKIGGGVQGRVGKETIIDILTPITGVQKCSNPAAFTDGADQETVTEAKAAIPLALSAGDRAVNIPDYVAISKAASTSVAKAAARENPDPKIVEVFIAPAGGGLPTSTLKNTVQTYLDARRMIGRRTRMLDPTYVDLKIAIDLYVDKAVDRPAMQKLAEALFLTPNPTDFQGGMFDFDNVGFGARANDGTPQLTIEKIFERLDQLKVAGVQNARISKFCNYPVLRILPNSVVSGNVEKMFFGFRTFDFSTRRRRDFRLNFIGSTEYQVFERIVGTSTMLTADQLHDDRMTQQSIGIDPAAVPAGAVINPNSRQGTTFVLSVAGTTEGIWAKDNVSSPTSMLNVAAPGDPYYIEFPCTPTNGFIDADYFPSESPHDGKVGWRLNTDVGTIPQAPGDNYIIHMTDGIANSLLLEEDEIPRTILQAGPESGVGFVVGLKINIITAE